MDIQRNVFRLTAFFLVGFGLVLGQITYWQTARDRELAGHPRNRRVFEAMASIKRGRILDRHEVALAVSEPLEGQEAEREVQRDPTRPAPAQAGPLYQRKYPLGPLFAHPVGYSSWTYGQAGIEARFNTDLLALEELRSPAIRWRNRFLEREDAGHDLILTLDTEVQRAAANALGARRGAVVAIDPRTGAILAMQSSPRFDPNQVRDRMEAWQKDEAKPLFNRAAQGLYPPGSTFKIFTAAAAVDSGAVRPEETFTCQGREPVGGTRITCFLAPRGQRHGRLSLAQGVAKSCNIVLAKVSVRVGAVAFDHYGHAFGFNEEYPDFDVAAAVSRIPAVEELSDNLLAECGFGQGRLAVTPLQMALVTAAIANRGRLMVPYLVAEVRSPEARVLFRRQPQVWKESVSPETADQVRAMMEAVMQPGGTGSYLKLPGVKLAGKTGTAENPHGDTHAWFVAFAPAEDPRVAVAVIVENGGTGGRVAGPVALAVIKAALEG